MDLIEFNEITPVLRVSNMRTSLDFYVDLLGMYTAWLWPSDENPNQVGVKVVETAHRDHFQLSQLGVSFDPSGWIFINVSNIDTLYSDYKKKGVNFSQELDNFPWGYREFWINDPDGNQIRFTMELNENN